MNHLRISASESVSERRCIPLGIEEWAPILEVERIES